MCGNQVGDQELLLSLSAVFFRIGLPEAVVDFHRALSHAVEHFVADVFRGYL